MYEMVFFWSILNQNMIAAFGKSSVMMLIMHRNERLSYMISLWERASMKERKRDSATMMARECIG
jgi:hypothetical protein